MKKQEHIIRTEHDRQGLANFVSHMPLDKPVKVTFQDVHANRSLEQNALSHKWYAEAAAQRDDMTADEVRAECKLVFGVPILRAENEEFKAVYDRVLKPLPYEAKREFIQYTELPVTSIMTVKQLSQYMDTVYAHFAKEGIYLTVPEQAGMA